MSGARCPQGPRYVPANGTFCTSLHQHIGQIPTCQSSGTQSLLLPGCRAERCRTLSCQAVLHSLSGLTPSQQRGREEEKEADRRQCRTCSLQPGTKGQVSGAVTAVRSLTPERQGKQHRDYKHAHTPSRVPGTWRRSLPQLACVAPSAVLNPTRREKE